MSCLTFIFYQKCFYDKIDWRFFLFSSDYIFGYISVKVLFIIVEDLSSGLEYIFREMCYAICNLHTKHDVSFDSDGNQSLLF